MQKSESIKNLAAALCAAQAEFPPVPFNAVNPYLKNKYANLGSQIETAKPILAKHGLAVSQAIYGGGTSIGVCTILMHTSGEYLESGMELPITEEKGKSQAQMAGSTITYLRRYDYAAVLGLYAEEDTDGDSGDDEKAKTAKAAAQKATAEKAAKEKAEAALGNKKTETLPEAKTRLVAELKAQFPEAYKDGAAIAAAMKSVDPAIVFDNPIQYDIVKAKLTVMALPA